MRFRGEWGGPRATERCIRLAARADVGTRAPYGCAPALAHAWNGLAPQLPAAADLVPLQALILIGSLLVCGLVGSVFYLREEPEVSAADYERTSFRAASRDAGR